MEEYTYITYTGRSGVLSIFGVCFLLPFWANTYNWVKGFPGQVASNRDREDERKKKPRNTPSLTASFFGETERERILLGLGLRSPDCFWFMIFCDGSGNLLSGISWDF